MSRVIPLVLSSALFMQMMDSTIIATSLPAIAGDLDTDPISLKLGMTSYLLAVAIFIPISGWMGDKFGAKNVYRWSIFVFMLGSMTCVFAESLNWFVISRFIQGMGGATMVPLTRLVLARITPKRKLVSAMAWMAIPGFIGPMMGPPIGGFLTTFWSWHWIFLINIPIGIVGIFAATIFLPIIEAEVPKRMDWSGFFLIAICLTCLLSGLSVISFPILPPLFGIITTFIGLLAAYTYLQHTKKCEFPLLDPKMFNNQIFRTTIFASVLFRITLGAVPFLYPLMLQIGFDMTAFESGNILLVSAIGSIIAKFLVSSSFRYFGFKKLLIITGSAYSMLMILFSTFTPETVIFVVMGTLLISGIIRSTFATGIHSLCFSEISDTEASQATVILAVSSQFSAALGVALAGTVLTISSNIRHAPLALEDFGPAFFICALFSFLAIIPCTRLSSNAGSNVSGHNV